MKHLVEFPMKDGSTILVEVDDSAFSGSGPGSGGTLRSARPVEMIEKAQLTYEEAVSKIHPAAENIITRMRALPDPPDEVSVEFGIKLSASAGAILAVAAAEGHFVLTMTWKSKNKEH